MRKGLKPPDQQSETKQQKQLPLRFDNCILLRCNADFNWTICYIPTAAQNCRHIHGLRHQQRSDQTE